VFYRVSFASNGGNMKKYNILRCWWHMRWRCDTRDFSYNEPSL